MKLQRLLSYVRRACDDYNMINDGDKIAVSLSGGKDSTALLVALSAMRRFYPKKFELEAVTVSLGFDGTDFSPMQRLCDKLEVPYKVIETDIGEIIFDIRQEKNPCSLCTKMRKGAFNNYICEKGIYKVAYGHNRDDVIETLFLSMFYEGRINAFAPVSFMDRMGVHAIRPLIYVPERDVIGFINLSGIQISKNLCKADGNTKRQTMKQFVSQCGEQYQSFEEKVFGAIQRSQIPGWNTGDKNGESENLL